MRNDVEGASKLMAALLRQPPKLHDEMKLGKASAKEPKRPDQKKQRGASAKPKTA